MGFGVRGSGFGLWVLGFEVRGLGLGVWGLGFGVEVEVTVCPLKFCALMSAPRRRHILTIRLFPGVGFKV